MPKTRSNLKELSQIQKFRQAARDAGVATNEQAFDVALKRIGKAPAPTKSKVKPAKS